MEQNVDHNDLKGPFQLCVSTVLFLFFLAQGSNSNLKTKHILNKKDP